MLKRKIAVAAAIARTSAGTSTLDSTGMSNDSPNDRTGDGLPEHRMQREPDRQIENHADHGGGDRRQRARQSLVAAQGFDERRAEEDPEEARA